MTRTITVLCVMAFALPAIAGPRRVLVLPLDGSADAPTRARLTTSVQRLARVIDGIVLPGDTTFAETAAAVGCDPQVPACADDVRRTLGVDELVYGTANVDQSRITIVLRRKAKGAAARDVTATVSITDTPERVEPALLPLFSVSTAPVTTEPVLVPAPVVGEPAQPPPLPQPTERKPMSRDRKFGIAAVAGGGLLVLFGLAAWSSASSVNDQIDNHDTADYQDFLDLQELESRASTRAWAGNVLVLGGLALGAYGGWLLWRDRDRQLTVTPAPIPGGAAVMFSLGARP
ncbi:MAG: hypothetical protein WKG01_23945 [Kofleriaceae bacterium]